MMSADTYGARTTPILFATELEGQSGAMVNQKGVAILPTPALSPAHIASFIAASEGLIQRAFAA